MRIIESEQFGEQAEVAAEVLQEHGQNLEAEQKAVLEIKVRRGRVHKRLEGVLGGRIAVANDTQPHVGGFITTGARKIHIVEKFLDDGSLAEKIIHHEETHREHLSAGITAIDFKKRLRGNAHRVIGDYLQKFGHDIDSIDFIEGFTEASTARKHGKNEQCAYNQKEVPAVEVLEELCRKELGQSVVSAFEAGNSDLIFELLESAAGVLTVKMQLGLAA
jgi:hypothetical protein